MPTVLVVDDEALVREIAARMLRQAGHDAIQAVDGRDAWAQLHRAQVKIDAVLADVVMPNMTGTELLALVLANRPDLPIALMDVGLFRRRPARPWIGGAPGAAPHQALYPRATRRPAGAPVGAEFDLAPPSSSRRRIPFMAWGRLAVLGALGACTSDGGGRLGHTAADSAQAAVQVCQELVAVKVSSDARFSLPSVKRDGNTRAFVGKGTAAASNANGVTLDHKFVCLVDPDGTGRGNVMFYDAQPEMYMELIRRFNL
jgi:response regulator receiver domain-containing protein